MLVTQKVECKYCLWRVKPNTEQKKHHNYGEIFSVVLWDGFWSENIYAMIGIYIPLSFMPKLNVWRWWSVNRNFTYESIYLIKIQSKIATWIRHRMLHIILINDCLEFEACSFLYCTLKTLERKSNFVFCWYCRFMSKYPIKVVYIKVVEFLLSVSYWVIRQLQQCSLQRFQISAISSILKIAKLWPCMHLSYSIQLK